MTGYQVVVDKIRGTGQAAEGVVDGLRGAGCPTAVPAGDLGMPGSRAALAMARVKHVLVSRQAGFESRLAAYAGNMAKAADHYASREDAAAADLSVRAPGQVKSS
ncbi:hypothetical protein DMH03_16970 [Amycolatopsis sp. WAC 01376]|uniref:hypothetical protein n=1 Tax=Amycolatopsis sp. WAC 01376 TaxID=2203195 RepID=UPI000F78BFDB|nr:hypothetical protein [Amycolatopsis sp. WAC 01376]RSM61482.1 hypothetical protein DMH03_16970 [Amycolatopsis sp. WAC 01376]